MCADVFEDFDVVSKHLTDTFPGPCGRITMYNLPAANCSPSTCIALRSSSDSLDKSSAENTLFI